MDTYDEMLAFLREWESIIRDAIQQMQCARELLGVSSDAPLPKAVFRTITLATHYASRLSGVDYETLMLWCTECQFGNAKQMHACIRGRDPAVISSLEDLARFVCDVASERHVTH